MFSPKKATAPLFLAFAASCMMAGCKGREKIDLSSTHTTAAETMAQTSQDAKATEEAPTEEISVPAADTAIGNSGSGQARLEIYQSGQVSIEYPSVEITDNQDLSKKVSDLLRANALSVIDAYGLQESEDALKVACKVISMDRSRLTTVYTGTLKRKDDADPVNIFYSNTVDLGKASNITFSQFADPYTMAGYVVSDDCFFTSLDGNSLTDAQKQALMDAKDNRTLDQYTSLFKNAGFPIHPDTQTLFPGTFSFEMNGTIVFSIPVPHDLGDYALVAYTPETK